MTIPLPKSGSQTHYVFAVAYLALGCLLTTACVTHDPGNRCYRRTWRRPDAVDRRDAGRGRPGRNATGRLAPGAHRLSISYPEGTRCDLV